MCVGCIEQVWPLLNITRFGSPVPGWSVTVSYHICSSDESRVGKKGSKHRSREPGDIEFRRDWNCSPRSTFEGLRSGLTIFNRYVVLENLSSSLLIGHINILTSSPADNHGDVQMARSSLQTSFAGRHGCWPIRSTTIVSPCPFDSKHRDACFDHHPPPNPSSVMATDFGSNSASRPKHALRFLRS
jgi:hypothetical protein